MFPLTGHAATVSCLSRPIKHVFSNYFHILRTQDILPFTFSIWKSLCFVMISLNRHPWTDSLSASRTLAHSAITTLTTELLLLCLTFLSDSNFLKRRKEVMIIFRDLSLLVDVCVCLISGLFLGVGGNSLVLFWTGSGLK